MQELRRPHRVRSDGSGRRRHDTQRADRLPTENHGLEQPGNAVRLRARQARRERGVGPLRVGAVRGESENGAPESEARREGQAGDGSDRNDSAQLQGPR